MDKIIKDVMELIDINQLTYNKCTGEAMIALAKNEDAAKLSNEDFTKCLLELLQTVIQTHNSSEAGEIVHFDEIKKFAPRLRYQFSIFAECIAIREDVRHVYDFRDGKCQSYRVMYCKEDDCYLRDIEYMKSVVRSYVPNESDTYVDNLRKAVTRCGKMHVCNREPAITIRKAR